MATSTPYQPKFRLIESSDIVGPRDWWTFAVAKLEYLSMIRGDTKRRHGLGGEFPRMSTPDSPGPSQAIKARFQQELSLVDSAIACR